MKTTKSLMRITFKFCIIISTGIANPLLSLPPPCDSYSQLSNPSFLKPLRCTCHGQMTALEKEDNE